MCARRFSPPRMMGRLNEPIKRQCVRFSWVGSKFNHRSTSESSKRICDLFLPLNVNITVLIWHICLSHTHTYKKKKMDHRIKGMWIRATRLKPFSPSPPSISLHTCHSEARALLRISGDEKRVW